MKITIVWRDESREPLKVAVESCLPEHGFLAIELTEDQLRPGVEHKILMFPSDLIASVEIEELKETPEEQLQGYREENTFREQPDKSPWFPGVGAPKSD